jgi:hypothetical protein
VVFGPPFVRGGFGTKSTAKIVSDTKQMKNTTTNVCDKTALVG